jgi:hypothetical protein
MVGTTVGALSPPVMGSVGRAQHPNQAHPSACSVVAWLGLLSVLHILRREVKCARDDLVQIFFNFALLT